MTTVNLKPLTLDFVGVRAGDQNMSRFTLLVNGIPFDVSGYDIQAQARAKKDDPAPSLTALIVKNATQPSKFLLSWPGDEVRTLLDSKAALTWVGIWDLQIKLGPEEPDTIFEGSIQCELDVTR